MAFVWKTAVSVSSGYWSSVGIGLTPMLEALLTSRSICPNCSRPRVTSRSAWAVSATSPGSATTSV